MYKEWMEDCLEEGFDGLHAKFDPKTGLRCMVAIHDLTAGPSLGGCRLRAYHSSAQAMEDVLRLARGMTFKSLLAGLPLGGGKAVIWTPDTANWDRKALFTAFGAFVESLGGKYITAVDMGTTVEDMDVIAKVTSYVTCTSHCQVGPSDPSSLTALGVYWGMKAAVQQKFGQDTFHGLTVAIQGMGHVGLKLAKLLSDDGAKLIVCDSNPQAVAFCEQNLSAKGCAIEDIYAVPCDVFSPCAIGGVLNKENIDQLKATVVAGAANNQLATADDGQRLHDRGILFAPDYVINSGGIIHVAGQYNQSTEEAILSKVKAIYDTTMKIFARCEKENMPPSMVADKLALEQLAALKKAKEAQNVQR